MQNNERFITNEERDGGVPEDVVSAINEALLLTDREARYDASDLMLKGATAIRKTYGDAAKHSYAWHKLAGSSVEHKGETIEPDLVREIDDAVAQYVREKLVPFLAKVA